MMMLLYNEVNLANVVVVVPGRALKGVALGGRGQVVLSGRVQQVVGREDAICHHEIKWQQNLNRYCTSSFVLFTNIFMISKLSLKKQVSVI